MASKSLIQALAVTAELCGGTPLSPMAAQAFLSALDHYPEAAVLKALHRCTTEIPGRLTPSLVIQRIDDGRPGAEEAWGIASAGGTDERITKVWTVEMAKAFDGCQEILNVEGPIPARMAFKEIYQREVAESRANGIPVYWHATPGWDKQGRIDAIEKAVSQGLLTVDALPEGIKYLAAPQTSATPALEKLAERLALEGPAVEKADDSVIDENMAKIRALLGGIQK